MTAKSEMFSKNPHDGAWLIQADGIIFPLMPLDSENCFQNMKKLCDIATLQLMYLPGDVIAYCDEEGLLNGKWHPNRLIQCVGPVCVVASDDDDGHKDLTRADLVSALGGKLHPCGWPMLREETKNTPAFASSAVVDAKTLVDFISNERWALLWSKATGSDWWHAPTQLDGKDVPINQVRVQPGLRWKAGCVIRREKIPDPSAVYPGPFIDTVSLTFLTVESGMQKPYAIAHLDRNGCFVRGQANCFGLGTMLADLEYFLEMIDSDDERHFACIKHK